jgi:hypothetical protein
MFSFSNPPVLVARWVLIAHLSIFIRNTVKFKGRLAVVEFVLLKDTLSRDFRPLVYFINQHDLDPWSTVESHFEYGFEFAKIFDYETAIFLAIGVNDTAGPWCWKSRNTVSLTENC